MLHWLVSFLVNATIIVNLYIKKKQKATIQYLQYILNYVFISLNISLVLLRWSKQLVHLLLVLIIL